MRVMLAMGFFTTGGMCAALCLGAVSEATRNQFPLPQDRAYAAISALVTVAAAVVFPALGVFVLLGSAT